MAKFEAFFTQTYVDHRDNIYLFFCTGICASNVSVAKYNPAIQETRL